MKKEIPSEPVCSTCRFWVQYVDGNENPIYGECHRFPPASQRVPSRNHREMFPAVFDWVKNWPRPDAEDWCGEYQPISPHPGAQPNGENPNPDDSQPAGNLTVSEHDDPKNKPGEVNPLEQRKDPDER